MEPVQTPDQSSLKAQDHLQSFDIIIAGGGLAGILAAKRISQAHPTARIALLEKEPHLGGRAITGGVSEKYGYGLLGVTPRLYEFWNQALKSDPEAEDLPALMNTRISRAAILMGNKLTSVDAADLCNERGARALGGLAASRQWSDVKSILEAENLDDSTFAEKWKSPRKSPAPMVLETYAQAFGITNIWDASISAIAERASTITSQLYAGDWQAAIDATVKPLVNNNTLQIELKARIIDAEYSKESGWSVDTAQGTFTAPTLIVAQPPWTASQWLPKTLWPSTLATIVSKTKPVSTVVLSCPLTEGDITETPQLIFIPAEGVHVHVSPTELVFNATIDYEMSVVAPDVVKAVKRLKRAHRKLLAALPTLKTGVEHVALVPVSWAQTPLSSERRHIDKIKMKAVQTKHLGFCGDAYGHAFDGDHNIVESISSACEAINL